MDPKGQHISFVKIFVIKLFLRHLLVGDERNVH